MQANNGCKSVGVIRLFIMWTAQPDTDCNLIQGLNEAFYYIQALPQKINSIFSLLFQPWY